MTWSDAKKNLVSDTFGDEELLMSNLPQVEDEDVRNIKPLLDRIDSTLTNQSEMDTEVRVPLILLEVLKSLLEESEGFANTEPTHRHRHTSFTVLSIATKQDEKPVFLVEVKQMAVYTKLNHDSQEAPQILREVQNATKFHRLCTLLSYSPIQCGSLAWHKIVVVKYALYW